MTEIELIRYTIETEHYNKLYDAISAFLYDNRTAFSVFDPYRLRCIELCLSDLKIVSIDYVMSLDTQIIEMAADVNISVYDYFEIGKDCSITERLRIEANLDPNFGNFDIMYIGFCLNSFT